MTREDRPVLVLGGTGWIGRNVTAAFLEAGHRVVTVARDPAKRRPAAGFVSMDLVRTPVERITRMLASYRPSIVVNAAGLPWGTTEDTMRSSMLDLTERVLAAERLLSFRPYFLQIGTVMEYGPTTEGTPITEATTPNPASPYGRIKLASSEAVLDACAAHGLNGSVVRLVNVAGPGTAAPSLLGRVLAALLDGHRTGEPAELTLAPLLARRDYLDVRDAAEATVAVAVAAAGARVAADQYLTGSVINIGSGRTVPVRWLVDAQIAASGIDARITVREPGAGGPASSGGGGNWLCVSPGLARCAVGWRARRPLTDAVRDDWRERVADLVPGVR